MERLFLKILHKNIFRVIPVSFPHFRVGYDIFADFIQFNFIANDVVVESGLPCKCDWAMFPDFFGAGGFKLVYC